MWAVSEFGLNFCCYSAALHVLCMYSACTLRPFKLTKLRCSLKRSAFAHICHLCPCVIPHHSLSMTIERKGTIPLHATAARPLQSKHTTHTLERIVSQVTHKSLTHKFQANELDYLYCSMNAIHFCPLNLLRCLRGKPDHRHRLILETHARLTERIRPVRSRHSSSSSSPSSQASGGEHQP